mmetsp:Transcript_27818/g.76573  ORF Transcript_27818/g.76573 Transcript_27818/m.76573 type:complete len:592 (+) Transcript_27818:178-1953(+)
MPDVETPHEIDLADETVEATPGDEMLASTDIRDPHAAVHGVNKPKIEAESYHAEDDPDALPWLNKGMDMVKKLLLVGLAILLVVYLLAAFIIDFHRAIALFVITVVVIAYHVYYWWASNNEETIEWAEDQLVTYMKRVDTEWKAGLIFSALLIAIMVIIMAATVRDGRNMVSLFGMLVFLGLTWLFSWKPSAVMVRPVLGSIFIQFIFGYCVIRTSWGLEAMEFLSDVFTTLLGYTIAGSEFVFAWLTDGSLFGRPFQLANDGGVYFLGPPFFFSVLPTVIFFSALMSIGYYIRAIPWAVKKVGYFLGICLGTSASESLSAAGNIFVGQTEAPLLVRPFMSEMTESELHAIMTGGFATIAGSVFGLYISFGIDGVAILAASIMSAPAALAVSKLAYPETEESPTATGKKGAYHIPDSGDANVVHAATNGAVIGTQLMLNIAGNLIAFLAIIEMLDQLIIYLGERVDIAVSFNILCEIFFYPFAWLMGIDGHSDCLKIANVLGLKIFANEFVAYGELSAIQSEISARSYYIASYALCGFSNFGSIGIQLGGLTPLAPNKGPVLAKLVFSAMIAGNTACLITACIAGIFYEED